MIQNIKKIIFNINNFFKFFLKNLFKHQLQTKWNIKKQTRSTWSTVIQIVVGHKKT